MQPWLIYLFGSGLVFFVGVGLVLLGLAASFRSGPVRSRVSPASILIGVLVAAGCATPLPIWFYAIAILLSIAWLAIDPLGPRVPARAKKGCRTAVALVWLAGAAAELPYHFNPAVPRVDSRQLYLFGDSLSTGLTDDQSKNWPWLLAGNLDLDLVSYAKRGARVADALESAENASLGDGIVLLEIGGNDLLGSTGAAEFASDLEKLLERVRAPGRTVVMFELPLPPLRNDFGRIQRSLAARYGVILIPKRVLIGVITTAGATVDALHLSAAGHRQLADRIEPILRQAFQPTGETFRPAR